MYMKLVSNTEMVNCQEYDNYMVKVNRLRQVFSAIYWHIYVTGISKDKTTSILP